MDPEFDIAPVRETDSLRQTYRYLRIGIGSTVLIIGAAVGVATVQLGGFLPSISAYYYTSARGLFVAALIAAAIGMIALSGRGFERGVLDLAALFAPLIALVPTPITPGEFEGFNTPCEPPLIGCFPTELTDTVENGIIAYLIVGAVLLVVTVIVAAAQATFLSSLPSMILAATVLAVVAYGWYMHNDFILQKGHFIAAGIFFGLIAIVGIRNFWPFEGEEERGVLVRSTFIGIGGVMAADVCALVYVALAVPEPGVWVFILECVALVLFLALWILQSGRKWDMLSPPVAAATPPTSTPDE